MTDTSTTENKPKKEMTVVEAYIKFNKQLVILVSGLSGCHKNKVAKKIAELFKIKYVNLRDFLKEDYYAKLAYKLKEISDDRVDGRIFMKGTRWAEIEEKDFKEKILDLVDNYDMHQERANSLKEYVVNNFDKNAVIKSYTSFFNKHIKKV